MIFPRMIQSFCKERGSAAAAGWAVVFSYLQLKRNRVKNVRAFGKKA